MKQHEQLTLYDIYNIFYEVSLSDAQKPWTTGLGWVEDMN